MSLSGFPKHGTKASNPDEINRLQASGPNRISPLLRVLVFVASRRGLRHGARLVPLCGIPMYLVEQASKSKNSAPKSGQFSISSGNALGVSRHKPDCCHELSFRFGALLVVWQNVLSSAVSLGLVELKELFPQCRPRTQRAIFRERM